MSDPIELAWLAGLFDGEGTVVMDRSNRSGYKPILRIKMTHLPTIQKVQQVLATAGVHSRVYSGDASTEKHKESWVLGVHTLLGVRRLTGLLLPYSVTKKDQLVLMQRFVERRLLGMEIPPDTVSLRGKKTNPCTREDDNAYASLRELNRTGPLRKAS